MIDLKAQVRALRAQQARNPQLIRSKSAVSKSDNPGFSANPQNPQAPTPAADPLEGLPLLPDDRRWLDRILAPISPTRRLELLNEYRAVWLTAQGREPNELRRENAGRRAANSWIRETLEANETADKPRQ